METITTPVWTLGDRLRKARLDADVTSKEMASVNGVSPNTVTNWENGHTKPARSVVLAYALRTGVPVWWLEGKDGPTTTIWYRALAQVKGIARLSQVLTEAPVPASVEPPSGMPMPDGVDFPGAA